jgi:2-iminobutanoate/2-iminopropanoate deaminase
MAKEQILTDKAPQPGGAYSQGLKVGDFVFVAGQVPVNPATRKLEAETIEDQTNQVISNIEAILSEAGLGLADVVKTTVHLSDMSLFGRFNEVYASRFPDPKPVRTTVGSQLAGFLVEIDVIAYAGK